MNRKITTEILKRLKEGDHQAFDTVFLAYFTKIKYFINGLVRSEEESEELAQDIFVKLWMGHEKIDLSRSFSSYMYTVSRNAALNYLKHKFVEDSYLRELPADLGTESSDEIIFAKETQLLINMTVSGMPEQRKRIYEMSKTKGLSNDEIANELKISKKTVENQLSLALKDIRQVISMFSLFFS